MPNPSRGGDGKLWASLAGVSEESRSQAVRSPPNGAFPSVSCNRRSPGRRKDDSNAHLFQLHGRGRVRRLICLVGTEAQAGHSRENPVVAAVKNAHNSIVTIKVEKHGAYSKKEVIGTGVIVDARGYVLTNRHVVSGGESVVAVLADGTELTAEVLVEDQTHDLAIVKLPAGKTYQELTFAPGQRPDGRRGSHRHRPSLRLHEHRFHGHRQRPGPRSGDADGRTLTDLIQTTASINPGNSGGPLLNINGELIGINSAMREDAQGIAFALNADMVQQVLAST